METNSRLLENAWYHEQEVVHRPSGWEFLRQGAQLLVMLIGGLLAIVLLWPMFEKGEELKREVTRKDKLISELERERDALQDEYRALLSDPATVEREARDKLNLARDGETIFRFAPYDTSSLNRPTPR